MSQPRIRSLKPENWHDEAVTAVSRDARLLRDVLLTYADDDGRWRHLPAAIIGFGYPEDDNVTVQKLAKWTLELAYAGLILLYEANGKRYGCFPRWHAHQYIQKYRSSELPAPIDDRVVPYRTRNGRLPDDDGKRAVSSTGRGRYDDRSASDPPRERGEGSLPFHSSVVDDARAQIDDPRLAETVAILKTAPRLTFDAELMGVANALLAYPNIDHKTAAHTTVSNASDPNYRTTDAGRALRYALVDLDRRRTTPPFAGKSTADAEAAKWAQREREWSAQENVA